MPADRRGRNLVVAAGLGLLLVGLWPWAGVTRTFSAAYSPLADLSLASVSFGRGRARLTAQPELQRRPGDNVTADALLVLSVDGARGVISLGISTRRDAMVPMVLLLAVALAAPLSPRQKAKVVFTGVPAVLLLAVAQLHLTVLTTFALDMRDVVRLSAFGRGSLDLARRTLLLPPGNRFVAPAVLALGLILWQRRRGTVPETRGDPAASEARAPLLSGKPP